MVSSRGITARGHLNDRAAFAFLLCWTAFHGREIEVDPRAAGRAENPCPELAVHITNVDALVSHEMLLGRECGDSHSTSLLFAARVMRTVQRCEKSRSMAGISSIHQESVNPSLICRALKASGSGRRTADRRLPRGCPRCSLRNCAWRMETRLEGRGVVWSPGPCPPSAVPSATPPSAARLC